MKPAALLLIAWVCACTAAHGITDLTFFAVSDVHFGQSSTSKDAHRAAMPEYLNTLPGRNYPATVGGGVVANPRGILVPGDLIDFPDARLWAAYAADYGVKGEGRIRFPVYDGLGNHDYSGSGSLVVSALRTRNRTRTGISMMDTNSMHYSWDWEGVHFVQLNVYSGTVARGRDPFASYDFLEKDLARNVGSSGRPVFVIQHFPMPDTSWWPLTEANRTAALLKKYNTIAILHGHTHAPRFYKYQGMDVYDDGTVMYGDILVFRITDGKMFVVNRIGNAWGSMLHQKAITMGKADGYDRDSAQASRPGGFRLAVEGLGVIHSGSQPAVSVEVRSFSGRLVRYLAAEGESLAWDRRDVRGAPAAPGLYLLRINAANGSGATQKVLLR